MMAFSFLFRATLLAFAVHSVAAYRQWNVNVGRDGKLEYDPPNLKDAHRGDSVTFHFFAKVCTGGFLINYSLTKL